MKNFLIIIHIIFLFIFSCSNKNKKNPIADLSKILGYSDQFFMRTSFSNFENRGNDMETLLKQTLQSTTSKAYCVFQDINLLTIIDEFKILSQKKLDVKIGLDEDNREQIGYRILSEFLSTRGEGKRLLIGNKGDSEVYMNICVIDDRRVFLSTAPPTVQGFYNETAFYFYIQSNEDGIIKKFAQTMDLITNGAFGSSKQKLNQRNHFLIRNADVGIYFAPEEKPIEFIQKRILGAKDSIQMYTTEFFSNKLDSDFDTRTFTDISYELLSSPAKFKQVVGSQSTSLAIDPSASGDCAMNDYLGITCDSSKTTGITSNNPRGLNSLIYLKKNGINPNIFSSDFPNNGLNFSLIDSLSSSPMAFISSHPYSSRSNSSHDGFMITLEDRGLVSEVRSVYDKLLSKSVINITPTGIQAKNLEIVISELNWMGGYKKGISSGFEYLELFNNTNQTINISDWKFECGVNGIFTNVFTFPKRTVIGQNQYFVITDITSDILEQAHLRTNWSGDDKIENGLTDQCRILDNFNTEIDLIGVLGSPFQISNSNQGLMNIDNKFVRSMERNELNKLGNNLTNWHTNSNNSYRNNANIKSDYLDATFGTPGYSNSPVLSLPSYPRNIARNLLINEIGIDDPNSNDQWVEIYNPTDTDINLALNKVFLRRDSSCSISDGSWTKTIALTGVIQKKGYYLVSRASASASILEIANQIDFETISNSNCIALTISDEKEKSPQGIYVIDFVNIGGAGSRENNSFVTVIANSSYSRCANGIDTNINANDFSKRRKSPKSENPCSPPPTTLVINEFSDGATNFDFIELKNLGTTSIILDSELKIEYGSGFSIGGNLFQYAATGNTLSAIPTDGVTIAPSEIILIVESDGNIPGLRAINGFTGKVFSLNRTSLMTSGSSQLTRQNQARLNYGTINWSLTPTTPIGSFTNGTMFLRNNFNFNTDLTTDLSKWGETNSPSPGVNNPN